MFVNENISNIDVLDAIFQFVMFAPSLVVI